MNTLLKVVKVIVGATLMASIILLVAVTYPLFEIYVFLNELPAILQLIFLSGFTLQGLVLWTGFSQWWDSQTILKNGKHNF